VLFRSDAILECEELVEHELAVERFCDACEETRRRGGRLFAVSCGSSYHAAKAAALFFNEIAQVELVPILPGEFRGQHSRSLRDGDLFLAISQSGETKDLIDVLNDVAASGRDIRRVALVNNVSSTIGQEKCDLVLPLRCGPEVAVPATKSFMNQMAVAYGLALRLAERRVTSADDLDDAARSRLAAELEGRFARLPRLPDLIRETFDSTDADVEQAARLLHLRPSLQILATRITPVALEGALKVREVVLNHTEGFEGSEFKHGPNTILGVNTVHGPEEIDGLLKGVGRAIAGVVGEAARRGLDADAQRRLVQAATDSVFSPATASLSLSDEERSLLEEHVVRDDLLKRLYRDYPLVYITGPDERDVQLTVSQINTHKIRGAQTVVIAEDHPDLRQAATKAPADNDDYRSVVITLPRTHDTLMTVFSATVVLQRLALKMSRLKMAWLDRIGLPGHGVHPDVPKNVSKSITVD
ncbi:MAG: SIS domain-containing protein, partial [Planctomycetota bacterium JB042]